MNTSPARKHQRRPKDEDILDKIEDFLQSRIEDKIKKGFDDVENFLKREFQELRDKAKGKGDDEVGPFSYLEQFLRDRKVASVAPSTKFLVGKVLKRMDLARAKVVVEYGPAEGVMTKEILSRLPADGRLIAVELNEGFVTTLRQQLNDPRLTVVQGSVTEIDKIIAPLGVPPADVIASGIPFSFLSPFERHQLLHKTVDLLGPRGRFVAYQVTTHLVPLMKYHFQDVDVDWEIRNLPPHFVFTGYR